MESSPHLGGHLAGAGVVWDAAQHQVGRLQIAMHDDVLAAQQQACRSDLDSELHRVLVAMPAEADAGWWQAQIVVMSCCLQQYTMCLQYHASNLADEPLAAAQGLDNG
jgi:hypothetical protein